MPISRSASEAPPPPGTHAGTLPTTLTTRPWLPPPAAPPDMGQPGPNTADQDACTPADRPHNMPITPHESAAMHRLPYNRLRASRGCVSAETLTADTPPSAARAALAGPRSPEQLTSFCPALSKHLVKPATVSTGRELQLSTSCYPRILQGRGMFGWERKIQQNRKEGAGVENR